MCGIIGVFRKEGPVAPDLYVGLLNLQHRGKESAGIAIKNGNRISRIARMGEVAKALPPDLPNCKGSIGIGQNRYSTAGASNPANMQPVAGCFHKEEFYLVDNGNLVNTGELRQLCPITFRADYSDTKIIAYLISHSRKETFEEAIVEVVEKLRGSFNLLILFNNKIYVIKDRHGFHPLQLGQREEDIFVASESCVFDHCGARFLRDVEPGEMIIIDSEGMKNFQWTSDTALKICIFEFHYFSRPDSIIHGVEVGSARYEMGRRLAWSNSGLDVDLVIPIPDSGNEAAEGVFDEMRITDPKIGLRHAALFRPHTVSRTFLDPVQHYREKSLALKFNARQRLLSEKRILSVEDSVVRGNTMRRVSQILKIAGVKENHLLSSAPPYKYPDPYGMDTYRPGEILIYNEYGGDLRRIAESLDLTSINYLSLGLSIDGILAARSDNSPLGPNTFYTGPFSGEYPDGTGDVL